MPTLLTPTDGCELYCDPHQDALASGQPVTYLQDYSGKGRTLASAATNPIYATAQINGKSVVYWDGTMKPLVNNTSFKIQCGWIVAKYDGAAFGGYNGLLTGTATEGILVGSGAATTKFFNFGNKYFEFRSNDLIYPSSNAAAPMNVYKLIFFRYWQPIIVAGIELGQDRADTTRKWNGRVAFVALYSRDFVEEEIRTYSQNIAFNFGLTLADVYPYQPDTDGINESSVQAVNFYDPPEGDRISESIGEPKSVLDLKFSGADQKEVETMKAFHKSHYASATPCYYRDYAVTPPVDLEGYITSPYSLSGANNNFNYSFQFRGK